MLPHLNKFNIFYIVPKEATSPFVVVLYYQSKDFIKLRLKFVALILEQGGGNK